MGTNNQQGQSNLQQAIFYQQSTSTLQFTDALAVGAIENETFAITPGGSLKIWNLSIISVQNLDWRLLFWLNTGYEDADINLDEYEGAMYFDKLQAFQIGGAGHFYYDAHGKLLSLAAPDFVTFPFPFPYITDNLALNIGLQVADTVTAKLAGVPGGVSVRILYEVVGTQ